MSDRVFVLGGANLDLVARSTGPLVEGSSNPGHLAERPGGVARNIAENLARLGDTVQLVAAIGDDLAARVLLDNAAECGIGLDYVVRSPHPTGRYAALHAHDGELALAINDMHATESLTAADVAPALAQLTAEDLVFVDANVPPEVVTAVAEASAAVGARLVADPVSVAKGPRMWAALHPRPWLHAPNLGELQALTGRALTIQHVPAVAAMLIEDGVTHVWVKLGSSGSILVSAAEGGAHPDAVSFTAPTVKVVDVTGAGDALFAGFLHAYGEGATVAEAAAYGHVVSALAVSSDHTVRPDLSPALVETAAKG